MNKSSSWEKSHKWYGKVVGDKGHYYHQNIIFPYLLTIFKSGKKQQSLLDLGCGQGILSRVIPKDLSYSGIDISPSLVKEARKLSTNKNSDFFVSDVTNNLNIEKNNFDYATFILSIQNMKDQQRAIKNTASKLKQNGKLIIVMNHPCFRVPRQTSWEIDEKRKLQYRRTDSYMSSLEIPILTHPSKKDSSEVLYSYHHPLSTYSNWLFENGFAIETIAELSSDKKSYGAKAKMENRARKEIPLFLVITAQKFK